MPNMDTVVINFTVGQQMSALQLDKELSPGCAPGNSSLPDPLWGPYPVPETCLTRSLTNRANLVLSLPT